MSAIRHLPQRPEDVSPGQDRELAYPPYPRTHPPFERHHYPYHIPPTPGMYSGPLHHPPPMHEPMYYHPPPPSEHHSRSYPGPSGYADSERHMIGNGMNGDGKKKRPRELSLSSSHIEQKSSPTRPSISKPSKPESGSSDAKAAPPVLVREKKQKACSNCRRAKLKCILNDGESECVRCKSRSERCVFFPRSHDEDWQQTITQDVYSALGQLQSMTHAMRHMVNHLVAHNMMPPLPPIEFPHGIPLYEVPDRDMTVLQGWNAEKGRDNSARKSKRKGRNEEDDDEEDFRYDMNAQTMTHTSMPLPPPQLPAGQIPSSSGWVHLSPELGQQAMQRLPPYRAPGHPGRVQLTPTSELDLPPRSDVEMGRPGSMFPYPPLAPSPSASMGVAHHPPQLPQMPGQIVTISPHMQTTTPTSLSSHHLTPPILNGAPQAISDLASHTGQDQEVVGDSSVDELITPMVEEKVPQYDAEGNPIIGSIDGRPNIIKAGYLSNLEAINLVQHFYNDMAPFMFGYQLEIGRFPFLKEGLVSLTPFILGVMCTLSSERLPHSRELHESLKSHVVQLLKNSPAESWQNFEMSRAEENTDETVDKLDPELGIGPEEIVGACILASYMRTDELGSMSTIAEMAFTWARGWIKLLSGAPRWSFAENLGIVPQERKADLLDMSRVWLLCYVIQGTQQLGVDNTRQTVIPDGHDPDFYCEQLIPPEASRKHTSSYDVILVYRAKIVEILNRWYRKSANLWNRGPNAAYDLKRLSTTTNNQLDEWREDLDSFEMVTRDQSRQLIMFYDFSRVLVNSHAVQKLEPQQTTTEPVRRACLEKAISAGLGFFERCLEWSPKQFAAMPTYDLNLVTAVSTFMLEAASPGLGYDIEMPEGQRLLSALQVRPLFITLADKFDERHCETGGFGYQRTAEFAQGNVGRIELECQR